MDVTEIRRVNLLSLYNEYLRTFQAENPGESLNGIDRQFAAKLEIHHTSLPQYKNGGRTIGPRIARQIESKCSRPTLWLDTDHAQRKDSPDEKQVNAFLKLATRAYKRATNDERATMTAHFESILAKSNRAP